MASRVPGHRRCRKTLQANALSDTLYNAFMHMVQIKDEQGSALPLFHHFYTKGRLGANSSKTLTTTLYT